jgi:hypothetical protein
MMADWIDTSEGILEENLAAASAIGNAADSASLSCRQDVSEEIVCVLCGRPAQWTVKSSH